MEAINKPEDDETTPTGKLLVKGREVTEELVTQKEHKDTNTWMEIKWIKTRNWKTIYELALFQNVDAIH
jgi:hypothetical protein